MRKGRDKIREEQEEAEQISSHQLHTAVKLISVLNDIRAKDSARRVSCLPLVKLPPPVAHSYMYRSISCDNLCPISGSSAD